ncbi:MAG: single-stranded-DNA-specific exonuclease RecJ [Candidatus Babeliaceae bacterium]|nr:single-stranded-DNA-specific exonuclease RecJ [Candidatus Babeliaceae bacterium]
MTQVIRGSKFLWQLPEPLPQEAITTLSQHIQLSTPILELLIRRGYSTVDLFDQFLITPREQLVADPALLVDAEKAVDRLLHAIKNEEKILIVGDYDVDGMTSTALLMLALLPIGARVNFFLPHRIKDGYGLSPKIVERAATSGYSLIITVDNGIAAHDAALCAQERGVDLIITDHHRPQNELPPAHAVVNPWRSDCPYPFKHLAGVGVAFKLLTLLYEKIGRELPEQSEELLALGTIADVMPLVGENRYWVRRGLRQINDRESLAIRTLRTNARLSRKITALDIGFFLTPQLNALGRLDDPRSAITFLISNNEEEVARIGAQLYQLNQDRRTIENEVISSVTNQIKQGLINPLKEKILIAADGSWPAGVIGLAASRLVSLYGRPVILLHDVGNGTLKGSGRSIPAFNLFDGLSEAQDLLMHFGGHAAAAGLAVQSENLMLLKQRLTEKIDRELKPEDFEQRIQCDASLSMSELNGKLCRDLAYLEPFGPGNEKPTFYLSEVSVIGQPVIYKDAHVRFSAFADGVIKPIIFFNRPDIFSTILTAENQTFDCAVHVTENEWEGRKRVELQGVDIALHGA